MATATKKLFDESELANFTGSENWYRHWLGKVLFTDGVKYVAEQAGTYWLIDEVSINQTRPASLSGWESDLELNPLVTSAGDHAPVCGITRLDGEGRMAHGGLAGAGGCRRELDRSPLHWCMIPPHSLVARNFRVQSALTRSNTERYF